MNNPPSATLCPRLFWPRFTLRALLVVVSMLCLGLAIWAHRAREQKRLVARIIRGGGVVEYNLPRDPRTDEPLDSSVPKWLLDRLGVDFFHSVTEVGTADPSVLVDLPRFGRLENLVVGDKTWTDEDFAPIARLRTLKSLIVALGDNETPLPPLGDASLAVTASLPRLESAWVKGSRITPEGIASLARSPSLRRINVACSDPAVDAQVAVPFREADRVSYFCIERFVPGTAVQTIIGWETYPGFPERRRSW